MKITQGHLLHYHPLQITYCNEHITDFVCFSIINACDVFTD